MIEDKKKVTLEEYFNGEEFAIDMFRIKYTKQPITGEDETPGQVFYEIADKLSQFEQPEKREHYRDIWFNLMFDGWFRPGGSVMVGVRSDKKVSLNNCTTLPLKDDTLEAIGQLHYDLMKCAAYRQGIGADISNLRPRGSKVNNAAEESTGTIPWMDMFARIGDYVGQLGRKPALLVSLNVKHPDIIEFISAKDKKGVIENANISVQITNDFMDAVENDDEWEMSFEIKSTGEVIRETIKARKLFRIISEHAYLSAEPGVQFIDKMRSGSMVHCIYLATGDDRFKIISTNACSEKPLAPYSVCNLLSINMEMFSTNKEEYRKELSHIVPYLVRLSDNVVQFELDNDLSPVPQQKEIIEQLREIGLGITNLHGWLLKDDIQYDSDEACEMVEDFLKHYAYETFKASMELGKEKGNAKSFELVKPEDLMKSTYFTNIVNEFFDGDPSKVTHMRNMAHMSIAPTGSLSNTFPKPCVSSGIEPIIGAYYWRRTRAINKGTYTYYFVVPNRIKEYIEQQIPQDTVDYNKWVEFSGSVEDNDGKIGLEMVDIINKYLPEGFFKPAHEINNSQKIKLMSKAYKWIDAAVSCTYNLPMDSTIDDVENIYKEAYKNDVRAVSVYRDGSRQGILIFEDPKTNKAKYEDDSKNLCSDSDRPEKIIFHCSPKRPKELPCNIHRCNVKGKRWLVIVGMLDDMPYELFAGEADDLSIPSYVKEGIIKKNLKTGTYSLLYSTKRTDIEIKNIAHVLMDSTERAMTRLISLNLRHGVPHEFIVKQLKKAGHDITDFATAISRILSYYIKQYIYEKAVKCNNCGEDMIRTEGCLTCPNCGNSKCG